MCISGGKGTGFKYKIVFCVSKLQRGVCHDDTICPSTLRELKTYLEMPGKEMVGIFKK